MIRVQTPVRWSDRLPFTSFVNDSRLRNGSGVYESERVYAERDDSGERMSTKKDKPSQPAFPLNQFLLPESLVGPIEQFF